MAKRRRIHKKSPPLGCTLNRRDWNSHGDELYVGDGNRVARCLKWGCSCANQTAGFCLLATAATDLQSSPLEPCALFVGLVSIGDRSIAIVYIDMDDVMCAYTVAHTNALAVNPDVEFPQGVPGFFLSLSPIDGAIAAINELRGLYDVYVLTAPSTRNPHSYSEKRIWIEQQFDYAFTKKLIISPNKGLLMGDYLIDDQNVGKGQDSFDGILIQFGSEAFPGWQSVLTFFNDRRRSTK